MLYLPSNGQDSKLRIITKSPESANIQHKERWLHFATEAIYFEDFERLALNLTFEHHADWVPVVMYLLDDIKDNHECSPAYGSYIRPGTVVRCDGTERHHRDKPDVSATFISFPFFDVGEGKPLDVPIEDSLHLIRSLFQQFYPQELTYDRDDDQQFRRFRQAKPCQYLRTPQLWILALNSTTIITCGPTSFAHMFGDFVEIIAENSLLTTGPSLIYVTDFYKRVTHLPSDQCRSFLALRQSIQEKCFSKTNDHIDNCLLYLGESKAELDPG
ncbi:hypothetical protein P153DRAFT_382654 [Dothidotthia symphoricarpi CBS 119687]|uniref:Uncharacterized protein n=1 Tax=Dothidotthia symphoricarpi CBS 119687 TaxID=1392245 RepID=A0A6A6AM66_9PLEO|nr:uncharacterized protein P153DRAFT_382654 [Dothidotthia symphoricarpi CBS 119687]KAF2133029.1 hypothetical protein P153DRAFT_382654 [Dothidotthia symphoricarpi CBS 119687]